MLRELDDMAMDLARTVHRQATQPTTPEAGAAPTSTPDPTVAFERVARTLRRTIALARKVAEPAPPAVAKAVPEQHRRVSARKQVIREVEDTIQRKAAQGAEREALLSELYERLDDPEFDADLAAGRQPVAEVIELICRDLGVADSFPGLRPWKRRTPADLRELAARAARLPAAPPRSQQPAPATPRPVPAPPPPTRTSTGPPAP